MEQKRKNRVFEDYNFEQEDSDDDNRKTKKSSLAHSLMDKLNFDNIPDDVPFGFTPMGIPSNQFDDKEDLDDGDDMADAQQFILTDYNDIRKQVEKDISKKVKFTNSPQEHDLSTSSEKVSFPLAPGQNLASLEELIKDLEAARKSQNHRVIVSLWSSCSKKASTTDDKIKFLIEKYRSLEVLKLPKLWEEVINDILRIDPQNVEFKFYQTKLLIENWSDIWTSQIEYLRARSLIEEKLGKYPEDYNLNKYLGELEQIHYSIKIKVQNKQKSAKNYFLIGGNNTNGTCGIGSDEPTHDMYVPLDELFAKKISSVATGDFHTLVVCQTFQKNSQTDIIGFGMNQQGQIDGNPAEESILSPKIISYFIGKQPRLVAAWRSKSVWLTETGDIYEWGFLGDKTHYFDSTSLNGGFKKVHTFPESENIVSLRCTSNCILALTKSGSVYTYGEIWQSTSIIFSSETFSELSFDKKSAIDFIPDFAKKFMEERTEDKKESEEKSK
jgi:hypothetical protein